MSKHVQFIREGNQVFAIVLRKKFCSPGVHFFTPGEFSQQFGLLVHQKGRIISRHSHKLIRREVTRTQEVLVVLKGKLKIEIYNDKPKKLKTVILKAGDSILLATGGHQVKIMEDAKIVEVKQGPYAGYDDKNYF